MPVPTLQDVIVGLVVLAALVFLVRHFLGPRKPKTKKGPDVPVSRLKRRGGEKRR
jgi:hypothetical protein